MSKKDVEEYVCRPYCAFFREGVKEDLICHGGRLLEVLLKEKALYPESLKEVMEGSSLSPSEYARLEELVCTPCPFMAEDCDFRSETPPPGAEPCGGFILLALLAGKDVIPMERLKEIAFE